MGKWSLKTGIKIDLRRRGHEQLRGEKFVTKIRKGVVIAIKQEPAIPLRSINRYKEYYYYYAKTETSILYYCA